MSSTLERLNNPAPAGFWPRFGALILDWLLVGALLCLVAGAGFAATDGNVRMAQPPLQFTRCEAVSGPPEGFDAAAPIPGVDAALQREVFGDPASFQPSVFRECRVYFLGMETDRTRLVAEQGGMQRWFRLPVDVRDRIAKPWVYLDHAFGLILLLALLGQESLTGRTVGKLATGLRVTDRKGGPPAFREALVRNLILWGPGALLGVVNQAGLWGLGLPTSVTALTGGLWGLMIVFLLWPLVLLVAVLASGGLPFWDRVAGTRVVRGRR